MHRFALVAIGRLRFDRNPLGHRSGATAALLAASNRLGRLDLGLQIVVDGTLVSSWDLGLTAIRLSTNFQCHSNQQTRSFSTHGEDVTNEQCVRKAMNARVG